MKYPGLLAATLALTPVACNDDSSPAVGQPLTVPLVTKETAQAGSVTVSNSESTLRVELVAADGWSLQKARVAGGTSLAHIPQKKGEPRLSRFPLQSRLKHGASSKTFSVPLFAEPGTLLTVAVQADVRKKKVKPHDDEDDGPNHDSDHDDDNCGLEPAWGAGTEFPKKTGAMYFTYTVQRSAPPTLAGLYRTHSQESWGQAPLDSNPATYLAANFGSAFPTGLVLGSQDGFTAMFRNSRAIEMVLPDAGPAVPFDRHLVDPRNLGNSLAAETLALALNAGLDAWDPDFAPGVLPLQDLVVADPSSRCFGLAVREVLGMANEILAGRGEPLGLLPEEILECVQAINGTFDEGSKDRGYLGLP